MEGSTKLKGSKPLLETPFALFQFLPALRTGMKWAFKLWKHAPRRDELMALEKDCDAPAWSCS